MMEHEKCQFPNGVVKRHEFHFNRAKLKTFVRFMFWIAMNKSTVSYEELGQIFRLATRGRVGDVGGYAGLLGEFCHWTQQRNNNQIPFLNSLIVHKASRKPGEGFEPYEKTACKTWGEMLSDCWQRFHGKERSWFRELDEWVNEFLKSGRTVK